MFGGDGELGSVEQMPYYTIHNDTPVFLQSILCERIVHCFRPTAAYSPRLAASRSTIAINVVRFLETLQVDFLSGTSRISPPVTPDRSSAAGRDNKEKGNWRTGPAKQ